MNTELFSYTTCNCHAEARSIYYTIKEIPRASE